MTIKIPYTIIDDPVTIFPLTDQERIDLTNQYYNTVYKIKELKLELRRVKQLHQKTQQPRSKQKNKDRLIEVNKELHAAEELVQLLTKALYGDVPNSTHIQRTRYYPYLGPEWDNLVIGPFGEQAYATRVRKKILSELSKGIVTLDQVRKYYRQF